VTPAEPEAGPAWAGRLLQPVLTPACWLDPGEAGDLFTVTIWFSGRRVAVTAGGVAFLGVDVSDQRSAAEAFRRYGIGYPSLTDPSASVELAFSSLIPPAIPDTLVLDRTGHVAARVIGQVTYRGLGQLIGRALAAG
jgi:hypothetical protein